MDIVPVGVLQDQPWVTRRLLDVGDYHRMGEAGIFGPEERVELIEGELITMAPIGSDHSGTVNALNRLLVMAVGDLAIVSVQDRLRLDRYSEPESDFTLLRPRDDFYRRKIPTPDDLLLVIEIANASLRYDRRVNRALYGRHGLVEFWLVNLVDGEIEICRQPRNDGYADISVVRAEAMLEPVTLPGVVIPAAILLG